MNLTVDDSVSSFISTLFGETLFKELVHNDLNLHKLKALCISWHGFKVRYLLVQM